MHVLCIFWCLHTHNASFLTENRSDKTAQEANELLKEPFCFIQTSDGKIVLVQHKPDEVTSVVNMKKGIAAAFQGNFKQTTEEVEEDTQSKHFSQYRYAFSNSSVIVRKCALPLHTDTKHLVKIM